MLSVAFVAERATETGGRSPVTFRKATNGNSPGVKPINYGKDSAVRMELFRSGSRLYVLTAQIDTASAAVRTLSGVGAENELSLPIWSNSKLGYNS